MKINEHATHPNFRFTDIYPFLAADATEQDMAFSGRFTVHHPNLYRPEGGITINLTHTGNEPYQPEEIELYIAGLQKALEISAGLNTAVTQEAQ